MCVCVYILCYTYKDERLEVDSVDKLKVRQGTRWYEYLLSMENVLKMKLWFKKMKENKSQH